MKLLTVSALLCAMMALTAAGDHHFNRPCPRNWHQHKNRCFLFVPTRLTWAEAERLCETMDANLASVHSWEDYEFMQKVISDATHASEETWIGGFDGLQPDFWFWIDGTHFAYTYWCRGEPNNTGGHQHCIQMNYSDQRCWDDQNCDIRLQSVCAKKIRKIC